MGEVYTLNEAAQLLGCKPSALRRRIRTGDLHAEPVRGTQGQVLLSADTVERARVLIKPRAQRAVAQEREQANLVVLQVQNQLLVSERDDARELADRYKAERDAERERLEAAQGRIEALKSVGFWGYLRGEHRRL